MTRMRSYYLIDHLFIYLSMHTYIHTDTNPSAHATKQQTNYVIICQTGLFDQQTKVLHDDDDDDVRRYSCPASIRHGPAPHISLVGEKESHGHVNRGARAH